MMKKEHHYIPQFYLRNFVHSNTPPRHSPYLWVFEKGKLSSYKKSPKNIAKKPRYYALRSRKFVDNMVIEDMFARIEAKAAQILRNLSVKSCLLSGEQREIASAFVVLMMLRVPQSRGNSEKIHRILDKFLLQSDAQITKDIDYIVKNYEQQTGNRIEVSDLNFHDSILKGDFYIKVDPEAEIWTIVNQLPHLSQLFAKMNWTFLTPNDKRRLFVTSDNPVIMIDPTIGPNTLRGVGMRNPGTKVVFPLRPDLLLIASWDKPQVAQSIPFKQVRVINMVIINHASKYIFADKDYSYVRSLVSGSKPRQKGDGMEIYLPPVCINATGEMEK